MSDDRLIDALYGEVEGLGPDELRTIEGYRETLGILRSIPDETPPANLEATILALARAEHAKSASPIRRLFQNPFFGVTLAAATCMLVAVIVLPTMRSRELAEPSIVSKAAPAEIAEAPPAPPAAVPDSPPPVEAKPEPSPRAADPARKTPAKPKPALAPKRSVEKEAKKAVAADELMADASKVEASGAEGAPRAKGDFEAPRGGGRGVACFRLMPADRGPRNLTRARMGSPAQTSRSPAPSGDRQAPQGPNRPPPSGSVSQRGVGLSQKRDESCVKP